MKVDLKKYRKVLVLGPLCVFSCILILYLFKGMLSKQKNDNPHQDSISKLNTQLPNPAVEEKDKNKLEIYMQSLQDSINKQREENNPAVKRFFKSDDSLSTHEPPVYVDRSTHKNIAQQEKRVNEQLDNILKELNSSPGTNMGGNERSALADASPQIDRLDQLIKSVHSDTASDPELNRLDVMLNKIMQIQNPKGNMHALEPNSDSSNATCRIGLDPENRKSGNNAVFFGLDKSSVLLSKKQSAIRAVVHETQTIQSGSTVKLRLIENVYVGQLEIPSGSFVYGTCDISDERLLIKIDRVVYNNVLYPVKLTAYDNDGIAGINIPGAVTRDATKEGIDRTIQTLSMSGFDGSVAAQATNAGIQSLSSLLRKKVKVIKVTIKAGHQIFLQ